MPPTQNHPAVESALRTAMIIRAALIMGVLALALVFVSLNQSGKVESGGAGTRPILTYIATGYGVLTFVVALVLPSILDGGIRNRIARMPSESDGERRLKLVRGWLTRSIVEGALLEGAALFCLIVYFLEKQPMSMIMAGLLALEMLLSFPTSSHGRGWIDRQNREMST